MGVIKKNGVNYTGGGIIKKDDYSTIEKKTGRKWIDGKDIWIKTYTGQASPNLSRTWVTVDNFSGRTLIGVDNCSTINDGIAVYPISVRTGMGSAGVAVGCNVDLSSNSLQIVTQQIIIYRYYLTVLYTKDN